MDWSYSPRSSSMTSLAIPLPPGRRIPRAPRQTATRRRGPGTRPMSPPSTQPAWTASAPPFLGAPAFRARQSLSRQGQDRRCLLAPLSTPAYSSASTPAVRWRATSFVQSYMWASLRKHLPFPHPQPGAAGVSLRLIGRQSRISSAPSSFGMRTMFALLRRLKSAHLKLSDGKVSSARGLCTPLPCGLVRGRRSSGPPWPG